MVVCTVIAAAFQPWILKYVVDGLQQALNREKLLIYAGIILGLSIVEGFFRFWMRRILIGASRDIEYDLRNDFLAHVQKMSLSFLQSRSTGDIMSRATNDLNAVRSVLGPGIMYSMNTIVRVHHQHVHSSPAELETDSARLYSSCHHVVYGQENRRANPRSIRKHPGTVFKPQHQSAGKHLRNPCCQGIRPRGI